MWEVEASENTDCWFSLSRHRHHDMITTRDCPAGGKVLAKQFPPWCAVFARRRRSFMRAYMRPKSPSSCSWRNNTDNYNDLVYDPHVQTLWILVAITVGIVLLFRISHHLILKPEKEISRILMNVFLGSWYRRRVRPPPGSLNYSKKWTKLLRKPCEIRQLGPRNV